MAEQDKHAGGRPLKIPTPELFDFLVDTYVLRCEQRKQPITLNGLILALGLSSRESLDKYGRRPEFVDSVKRAKLYVALAYELRLHGPNCVGAIFALKNMGWSDKQDVALDMVGGLAGMFRQALGVKDSTE